jgi:hypothetical protein
LVSPFSSGGAIEGVVSSAVVAVAVTLVTFDLLTSPDVATAAVARRPDHRPEQVPAAGSAT